MKEVLLSTQYLPSLAYISEVIKADKVWVEAHEHYQKQSYRNRCYILAANGIDRLTVPVLHSGKVPIQELAIDYRQKWQNRHWRAIQSAYAHAPFFEFFQDAIAEVIYSNEPLLFNLNQKLLSACLQMLGIRKPIVLTTNYQKEYQEEGVLDLREAFHPKKKLELSMPSYIQVFGEGFEPNLSILDLLFCEGTNAANSLLRLDWSFE